MDVEFESKYELIEGLNYPDASIETLKTIEHLQSSRPDHTFKIAIVGPAKGGKSSAIAGQLEDYKPTLGVAVHYRQVTLPFQDRTEKVLLELWEYGSLSSLRFDYVVKSCLEGADAVCHVFSV